MMEREWTIGKYRFRSYSEYQAAKRDQKLIETLKLQYNLNRISDLEKLSKDIAQGKIKFETVIGQDFDDKIFDTINQKAEPGSKETLSSKTGKKNQKSNKTEKFEDLDEDMQQAVRLIWKKKERRKRRILLLCSIIGGASILIFGFNIYQAKVSGNHFSELSDIKKDALKPGDKYIGSLSVKVNKTQEEDVVLPPVLTEYENLYSKNKNLIGWIKIADTNIDYPVMQTEDNEFYLTHNFNKEDDKNGCIFMDKNCDVVKHSTNYILYGHHMQSGNMFGFLYKYENEAYGKEHSKVYFDTIYEKGIYQVMYVFRSKVYSEEDVSFKYYQFIDANSAKEFQSYMNEMAKLSYYDTGVTAAYGDQLLTLSTCDYEEKGGRFVVVCKKIS